METGISVYLDDGYRMKDNMEYIDMASSLGVSRLFTSFSLAAGDKSALSGVIRIIEYANSKGMDVMVDVFPEAFKWVGASIADLKNFYKMGVSAIRCDYGFDAQAIAAMSSNPEGIDIVINASTATVTLVEEIMRAGGKIENIRACHNFYPHPYTGLSRETLAQKAAMLKAYGLEIAAFVPSQARKRGPIHEGLPTIEDHRKMPAVLAAKELAYGGMADVVYFGDAYASFEELKRVLRVDPHMVELEIQIFQGISDVEREILLSSDHVNRMDASEYVIRSSAFRAKVASLIPPFNCIERDVNMITIDNEKMGRYMGELQIVKQPLPQDGRVNVVGKVDDSNSFLVGYIGPGSRFKFTEKDG